MAISLRSMAMASSVLRGPWPGNRHATLRRGSHERKIVAGYAKSAYPITGKSCATRWYMKRYLIVDVLTRDAIVIGQATLPCMSRRHRENQDGPGSTVIDVRRWQMESRTASAVH